MLKFEDEHLKTMERLLHNMDTESFAVMAQNLNVLIIIMDQDLKLQYGNDVFFNLVGWQPTQVLGQDYVQNFIPAEMTFVVRTTLREIMDKRVDNYSGSNQVLTQHHGIRYINWNSVHLRSPNGQTQSMVCLGIDITDNNNLRDFLRRTESEKAILLDNVSELVVYHDSNGRIVWVNQAFAESVGTNRDNLLGTSCYDHFRSFLSSGATCTLHNVFNNGQAHTSMAVMHDGSSWEANVFPLKEDGIYSRLILIILSAPVKIASLSASKNQKDSRPHIISSHPPLEEGIGVFSEKMRWVMRQAEIMHADRSVPVLIEGETGTGKELVARHIHFGQEDVGTPFIDINCAAITPTIFESELFGYEGGSFTGGRPGGQKGKLDLASGGTLFLDEIGEIPVSMQAKLLRVIQEKEYYRVGGLAKRSTDVRLICATNVDLEKSMLEGSFRRDLFYRLEAIRIHIPPLRERRDDILPLAGMFLHTLSRQKGKRFVSINQEAATLLLSQPWPGNVRQLRNVIERIVLMWDDVEIRPEHVAFLSSQNQDLPLMHEQSVPFFEALQLPPEHLDIQALNKTILHQALAMHGGNKTQAAKYLGISRRAFIYRLEQGE